MTTRIHINGGATHESNYHHFNYLPHSGYDHLVEREEKPMTDEQYHAHTWLSRMWNADIEINLLIDRRDKIIGSMSGIGKYDAEHIPTQNGENATESKNIEYSYLSEQIEKKMRKLSAENVRTHKVINKVDDTMLRGMLESRYINRKTWSEIGKAYNYEKTRTYYYIKVALDKVSPYIPEEVVVE